MTGNSPGQVVVTDIDPVTLGDETSDSDRDSPLVSGLLGYRIAVGHFTENVLRKLHWNSTSSSELLLK